MSGMDIPYPMLSDGVANVAKSYDVFDEQNGKTLRGTFIIGPQGTIHGMELLTNSIGRCPEEILRQLKAFQNYVESGEMAPCNWKPGDKTLSANINDAGQVCKKWKAKK